VTAGIVRRMRPGSVIVDLTAGHAGDAQVVVLRSRHAARRCLAGVAAPGSAAASAVAVSEKRS
jgi:hypothetical protein